MKKIELPNLSEFSQRLLLSEIERLKNPEKPHLVFILPAEEKRSMPQNKYYWGVVLEDIADFTGYWPDEIHDFNKKMFGMKSSYYIGEEAHELIKGLSKMGRKKATEFVNRVIEHWVSQGVIIREPDQLTNEEFYKAMMSEIED